MKKFPKYIFILRHGERADAVENCDFNMLKCGKYDSELTENGKRQAYEVGNKIKQFLMEKNITHINSNNTSVISSPFARTIITGHELIRGLNLSEKIPLTIEKGLSERLNEKWYPHPPETFLLSTKEEVCEKREFLNSQIEGLECHHKNLTEMPKYPESYDECLKRFAKVYNILMSHYLNYERKDIIIMVTHFIPIEIFVKYFYNIEYKLPFENCITLAFYYDENACRPIYVDRIYPKI